MRIGLSLLAVFITAVSYALHPWEVQTLTFTARGNYTNPYIDIPVQNRDDLHGNIRRCQRQIHHTPGMLERW
jgi:hypothetical protein